MTQTSRIKRNRRKRSLGERLTSAREAGRRLLKRIGPVVALAAVAFGLPLLVWNTYHHVLENPYFKVALVEVSGHQVYDEELLIETAGIVPDMSVFDVDTDAARARLEELPWLRSAEVRRTLPDTVSIAVVEREAVAVLVDDGYHVLDESLEVFKEVDATDPLDSLFQELIVTGARAFVTSRDGRRLMENALRAQSWAESKDGISISEFHLDSVMGLSFMLGDGTEVRVGHDRIDERLERLEAVATEMATDGLHAHYILLDQSDLDSVTVGPRRAGMIGSTANETGRNHGR